LLSFIFFIAPTAIVNPKDNLPLNLLSIKALLLLFVAERFVLSEILNRPIGMPADM